MFRGADIDKTNYCGDIESFKGITASAPMLIIVAGGPGKGSEDDTINLVRDVVAGGAAGVSIGRCVWQSEDPQAVMAGIHWALFAE